MLEPVKKFCFRHPPCFTQNLESPVTAPDQKKMRSLTPIGIQVASLHDLSSSGHAAAIAVDPESGTLYVLTERKAEEGGVDVDIRRIVSEDDGISTPEVGFQSSVQSDLKELICRR